MTYAVVLIAQGLTLRRVVERMIRQAPNALTGMLQFAAKKPQEGEVIAAGPGARDDSGQLQPLDVKVGDRILFGKWSRSARRG